MYTYSIGFTHNVALVAAQRSPLVPFTNKGKVIDRRDANLSRKVMPRQEGKSQKIMGSNPGARKRHFLLNIHLSVYYIIC